MTPSEIEAELGTLRAQISKLQEQQDIRAKAWASLGVQYRNIAAVLLAAAVILLVLQIWYRDSSVMPLVALIVVQTLPLSLFRASLRSPTAKAERA